MKTGIRVAVAAFALAGVAGLLGCSKKQAVQTIYVGVAVDTIYGYLDDKGNYVGYEAEMLQAIDDALPQYEFKYEYSDLKGILLAVCAGKNDIGLKQYESNEERRKNYLFSEDGYLCYDSYITVLKERNDIHSLADLQGKTVHAGSTVGAAFGTLLENYNKTLPAGTPKINVVYAKQTKEELLSTLRNGSVDATTMTKYGLRSTNEQFGDVVKAAEDKPCRESYAYILFNKEKEQLKKDVDAVLHELVVSGKLSEISQRTLGFDYKDN